MKVRRRLIAILALGALITLGGCASIPSGFEQVPSETWQHPEDTRLGALFEQYAPADDSLSGVRLLSNPREAFKARFGFAGLADRTLDLQYYLWKGDLTGELLLYRALEAADRGVQVRVLIDDIYHAGRDQVYAAIDSHPNFQVRVFNPMGNRGFGRNANMVYHKKKLDHRMHNKIFLVDGAVAVLGGRNIGDDYFGIDPDLNFRDLDVLAVGPAATEAGAAFDEYWNSRVSVPVAALLKEPVDDGALDWLRDNLATSLDEVDAIPYTVPIEFDNTLDVLKELASELIWADAEVVVDSLDRFEGGNESAFVELTRRVAASVQQEVVIQTAYLIPSKEGIADVEEVTGRGVRVRILTNSYKSNNHATVHSHYKKKRKKLIKSGAELHELQPHPELLKFFQETDPRIASSHAGLHAKAFVVDRRLSMIGSYNMDPRSRIWNSEIGLLIDSEVFAERVLEVMEEDFELTNSYRLTLDTNGDLVWTAEGPDGTETWHHDPGASAWNRFVLTIMGWVPMGSEL